MDIDDVNTDTISADYEHLDQLVSMVGGDSSIAAAKLEIETRDGNTLVVTGDGDGGIEVSEP